jgi:hypothetical protein
MILQYQKAKNNIEILNDLIMIQNERIAGYQLVLEATSKEPHFNNTIRNLIDEGLQFKYLLIQKISQLEKAVSNASSVPGRLYGVWKDLKIKSLNSKGSLVIANCQYNEVIALHVANAALNYTDLAPENRTLIEGQEAALRNIMHIMRHCNQPGQFSYPGLMYFN